MSIQSEIDRIKNNVTETYSAISEMGGTVPDEQNSENLAGAVRSIPQGPTYTAGEGISIEDDVISSLLPSKAITQEGYNALSSEAKNADVLWIISDASPEEPEIIPATLNECSWELISELSQNGTFSNYFSVGDTKTIVLNGPIGDGFVADNLAIDLVVVGINHNMDIEGGPMVHFMLGTIDGTSTALTGNDYFSTELGVRFNMNNPATNSGGWAGSQMCNNIMPALKNALPEDLRSVMRTVKKWTNNSGSSQTESAVTETDEELCLPSEFELFGEIHHSNLWEGPKQQRYQYFTDFPDSLYFKKSNNISSGTSVYSRSPSIINTTSFSGVQSTGISDWLTCNYVYSLYAILFV